ncbi:hypothetical protein B0T24DRAFT_682646 [Lasiosphaeria ovina]|uniref:Uncharacterized protein n=1 Tax=Lasiosphaeria ovina TaxID=92902 RepID=A0AAE0JWW0_9PEZI|nr:hypothetical protein B0T24DRAFT_682646 [Lasiosphaeria ovina]
MYGVLFPPLAPVVPEEKSDGAEDGMHAKLFASQRMSMLPTLKRPHGPLLVKTVAIPFTLVESLTTAPLYYNWRKYRWALVVCRASSPECDFYEATRCRDGPTEANPFGRDTRTPTRRRLADIPHDAEWADLAAVEATPENKGAITGIVEQSELFGFSSDLAYVWSLAVHLVGRGVVTSENDYRRWAADVRTLGMEISLDYSPFGKTRTPKVEARRKVEEVTVPKLRSAMRSRK